MEEFKDMATVAKIMGQGNETPVAPDDSTGKGQMGLSVILDEIEHRAKRAQYNYDIQRTTNEIDVPALVKALRRAMEFIYTCNQIRTPLLEAEITAILTQREP